ncbi:hypothetical protein [Glycomyces xiaoerkulensis]|uniref:hypothetical protein n=1 Tax=Glycomyces xiaoerkulensis TaxID=2038139 RepID=UPI000C266D8A|nr:hypothetical protein [Glycomyces xiaoerkulensis]
MLAPATPAQAESQRVPVCHIVWERNDDGQLEPHQVCIYIELPDLRLENPCPPACGPVFDWRERINPVDEFEYFERWNDAFRTLNESRLAEDPELERKLRHEATERFLGAARILEGSEVELNGIGWFDPETGESYKSDSPRLWEIGEQLAEGQRLMSAAVEDREAVEPAMEAYDAALDGFGYE